MYVGWGKRVMDCGASNCLAGAGTTRYAAADQPPPCYVVLAQVDALFLQLLISARLAKSRIHAVCATESHGD